MKSNPFAYGRTVDGEDYCPRRSLERIVRSNFLGGQNMAIHGERRIGKTSLVTNVARRLPKKRLVYADFLFVNTPRDVVERIASALLETASTAGFLENAMKTFANLRPTMSFDTLSGSPTFSLGSAPESHYTPETVESALEAVHDLSAKNGLVVVFDEFQDILRLSESSAVLARMRSRIQFHKRLTYAFTGSHRSRMVDIFSNPDNPLYKSAMPIAMEPIPTDELWEFLAGKFDRSGIKVAADLRPAVAELGIEATGDLQQLCRMVWDKTRERSSRTAAAVDVPAAISEIFRIERSGYEEIASSVSPSQLKLLKGIAKMGGGNIYSNEFREANGLAAPGTITTAYKHLERRRLIYRKEESWKIDSPFFRLWLASL